MTRKWLNLLIVISMLLILAPAALAAPPAPFDKEKILSDNKIVIAWIPKALNNPVFEIGKVGAETKAKELSEKGPYQVEILYTASVASDMAEQARVIEDVVAKGVDAIGVSCNDPTGCEDPINKAVAAGIPVMTWDSDSPKSQRFTYLGVDNYEGGKAAAMLMQKALPNGGKVALLTGVPGAFNLEERIRGFKDGVQGSNIEIVTTVACNDDINLGVQVVEETMQAYPDLAGWFFVGLWPLFAERGSMPLWEKAAKAGMQTVAFDTLPVELDYLKEGLLYGLVGQKYWGWGYDTVQMIYDAIVNGKQFESFTNSGMDIVTARNVDVMAEAWKTQDFTKPLPPWFDASKWKIGYIYLILEHPYYQAHSRHVQEYAKELGFQLVEIDGKFDAAVQANAMEDLIAQKVDGIVFCLADEAASVPLIQEAQAAGIPVVTFAIHHGKEAHAPFVGIPEAVTTEKAGIEAAKRFHAKFGADAQAYVATVECPAVQQVVDRADGFIKGFTETDPKAQLVARVDGGCVRDKALAATEDLLQSHPEVNVIYGGNGDSGLGALAALQGIGRGKADDVFLVSHDGSEPELIELVNPASGLKLAVANRPRELARGTLDVLFEVLNGQRGVTEDYDLGIPSELLTPDDIDYLNKFVAEQYFSTTDLRQYAK